MDVRFYHCEKCKNSVTFFGEPKCNISCCNQDMTLLSANTTEASKEKHVPVVTVKGSRVSVQVGSEIHPMSEEHYIQWIVLVQSGKFQRVDLDPSCAPMATFILDTLEDFKVYEYCNLHGLWMTDASLDLD